MKFYKLVNNVTGWIIFLVALVTYTLTLEATTSFWDCGEFISGAYKMQVVHPPGAPLFLLVGRIFTLFAFDDPTWIAWTVNFLSGLTSAFAVLFLFWITTGFAKKIIFPSGEPTKENVIVTMAAGVIAALSCTWADTIWFSAAEGEVYAMSLFFMMLVFWCMMKWESWENEDTRDRWLVLIALLLGISSGVHLLSFLAIPGMALIFYFKKYETPTVPGVIAALGAGFAILGLFFKGIISKVISIIAGFELAFVQDSGAPYGTGFAVFFVLTTVLLLGGLIVSHASKNYEAKYRKGFMAYVAVYLVAVIGIGFGSILGGVIAVAALFGGGYLVSAFSKGDLMNSITTPRSLNTFFLCLIMVFMGFSTYFIVIIRANANTPINMNDPSDVFALESYLNREQYGDRPLLYGPHYDAYPIDKEVTGKKYVPAKDKDGNDTYVEIGDKIGYVFDPRDEMFFPRLGSWQDNRHAGAYRSMLQPDFSVTDKSSRSVQKIFPNTTGWQDAQKAAQNYLEAQSNAASLAVHDVVKESHNWQFFLSYQVGVMYFRYFMWNFSGRQNDYQGRFDNNLGEWVTGFDFIDEARIGDQTNAPDKYANNGAHNVYYMIPFILGIIGFVFHFKQDYRSAIIVLALFSFAGVLQVVYLNSPPFEPRERDYTLVGSFVTFCLWIGFGLLAIYTFLRDKVAFAPSIAVAFAICLVAPVLLATQNWDDHDRSNRYTARDYAINYLNSVKPNAIIFTQGDNDTYPLWYVQEVEGVRTDVRVVNLSLLGVDWYVEQLNYAYNDAAPIRLTHTPDKYQGSNRDYVQYYNASGENDRSFELLKVMQFIASEDPSLKLKLRDGSTTNYLPTRNFKMAVDSAMFANSDIIGEQFRNQIVSEISWKLPKTSLLKNDLITLDIIANNLTSRPIYFAVSVSPDSYLGLANYLQLEGLAYRIVPVKGAGATSTIASEIMYDNLMNNFAWGGVELKDTISYTIQEGDSLFGVAYEHDMTVTELTNLNGGQPLNVKAGDKIKVQVVVPQHMDENVLRMTMNLRSNFGRLAERLLQEQKPKQAELLLDRCMYVLPEDNVPLDAFMYQFPHIYYQAGNKEKAQFLIRKLLEAFEKEYFYAIDTYEKAGARGSAQRAAQVVQILGSIAKDNNDAEMQALIGKRLSVMNTAQPINR